MALMSRWNIKFALLCLLLLVVVGCQPRREIPRDTLVIGQVAEPMSLDPHRTTALNDFRIAANVYEGLVRFRAGTLEIEPGLASQWSVSPDGLRYVFDLQEGITFHDGTPFDAEAVRFNLERMLKEDHAYAHTGPFPLSFFFNSIVSIETPSPFQVVLVLDEPFAPLLSNLASPTGFMVSPAAVEKHEEMFGRNPVGTGPYQFARWESNRLVELEQFPDYWDGEVRTEKLIFRPITDENARLTELLAGGVDLVAEVPPDIIQYLREHEDFRTVEAEGPHLWFLILNTRHGPFADVRVRQAINYAIDRKSMVEHLLQNTATAGVGAIPRAFAWAVDPSLEPYPYDPDKARALLDEAGVENVSLTLYATESGSGMLAPREMAVAIQGDLSRVGVQVRIETFEWNSFLARVNAGLGEDVDMAQMAWMINDPDTLPFLALRREAWPEAGGFNSGYYDNAELDELLIKARRALSQEQRAELYQEVDRLVYDDAPWVFVASWKQNAVAHKSVQNLQLEPSFLFLLRNVWKHELTE
ncbi:MAG: ABC transporter substrate-binding protein [Verrucomicrobiales bacterium]